MCIVYRRRRAGLCRFDCTEDPSPVGGRALRTIKLDARIISYRHVRIVGQ